MLRSIVLGTLVAMTVTGLSITVRAETLIFEWNLIQTGPGQQFVFDFNLDQEVIDGIPSAGTNLTVGINSDIAASSNDEDADISFIKNPDTSSSFERMIHQNIAYNGGFGSSDFNLALGGVGQAYRELIDDDNRKGFNFWGSYGLGSYWYSTSNRLIIDLGQNADVLANDKYATYPYYLPAASPLNGTLPGVYVKFTIEYTPATPPTPDPVPEPATMLLFGSGLVGLAGVMRKKKKY